MIPYRWETEISQLPDDYTPMMTEIREYMAESVAQNFVVGGRPTMWQALDRGKGQPSHLVRSGALLGSMIVESGEDWAEVNMDKSRTGIPYANIHNFGGTIHHPGRGKNPRPYLINMPQRQYMLFQEEDLKEIQDRFSKFLFTFMGSNKERKTYG